MRKEPGIGRQAARILRRPHPRLDLWDVHRILRCRGARIFTSCLVGSHFLFLEGGNLVGEGRSSAASSRWPRGISEAGQADRRRPSRGQARRSVDRLSASAARSPARRRDPPSARLDLLAFLQRGPQGAESSSIAATIHHFAGTIPVDKAAAPSAMGAATPPLSYRSPLAEGARALHRNEPRAATRGRRCRIFCLPVAERVAGRAPHLTWR